MASRVSLLVAPGYGLAACLVAVGLPYWSTDVTVPIGLIIGTLVFLACALAHLACILLRSEQGLQRQVGDLNARQQTLEREIAEARREAQRICDAILQSARVDAAPRMPTVQGVPQRLSGSLASPSAAPPLAAATPASGGKRDVLDEVRDALAGGRVDLLLQPIVTLPQRRRRFFESFSRIRAEDGRVLLPEEYVPVAARDGLISTIDNTLLFRCIQLIRRSRERNGSVGFFCNISRHSLADRDFFRDLSAFLGQNGDLAPSLIFEMSQSELDLGDDMLRDRMRSLAELGIRFSIDHVTDYAVDAAALAERNVRFLKADISDFHAKQGNTPWETPLFRLRRNLAAHRIELIVAKVEREQQVVEMLEYDIDFGQGYLFGQPKPGPSPAQDLGASLPGVGVAERQA